MFNLTSIFYQPKAQGIETLHLLSIGLEHIEIAKECRITVDNLHWHIAQLKLKLGVKNIAQLMFEFGKWHQENSAK